MFCRICGSKMEDDALFCTNCGTKSENHQFTKAEKPAQPVSSSSKSEISETVFEIQNDQKIMEYNWDSSPPPPPNDIPPSSNEYYPLEKKPKRKMYKIILAIVIPLIIILLAISGFFVYRHFFMSGGDVPASSLLQSSDYEHLISEGKKNMANNEFDRAIANFKEALNENPDSLEAAVELSRAYMMNQDFEKAKDVLSKFNPDESDEQYNKWRELSDLAEIEPTVTEIDVDHFPQVKVSVSVSDKVDVTKNHIFITEDSDKNLEITDFKNEKGKIEFTYISDSEDAGYESEQRDSNISIVLGEFTVSRRASYETPIFEPATLTLISTDTSEYPKVKAYFRVQNAVTGETIKNIDPGSFIVKEQIQGGEYLAREIREVSPLEDKVGLNINLATDKSGSIDFSDMDKIKRVMSDFVDNLQYDIGDKAEILAFDSIVQQMCYYTNDVSLLKNGIYNMSPDGQTALYDAIYMGVNHSALQGGARCVIVFTDGHDNASRYSQWDVIDYSILNQVPVYIIGVGSQVDTYTLTNIAQDTGGRYWFIDDLYDLEEIYKTIYAEQKELYLVEYESDGSADRYLTRHINVSMSSGGYKANCETAFSPVRTVYDNGVRDHSSRYEIIKENMTWEEASQYCQDIGGHLATITSQDEMDIITELATAEDAQYIWLGGYTSYNPSGIVYGHWVTGEPFIFEAWAKDEPSRVDKEDGVEEWYIMLWNVESLGGWTWNDQRNDPADVFSYMEDKMAFVCEFED